MTGAMTVVHRAPYIPLTEPVFLEAWWALVGRHLPLKHGRDTVYVSPEGAPFIPNDMRLATSIDLALRGVELRLVRR